MNSLPFLLWDAAISGPHSAELAQRKRMFNLSGQGHDLLVPVNTEIILGAEGAAQESAAPFKPRTLVTTSLDQYKQWIGRPDSLADNHPWEMPEKEWTGKRFHSKTEL